MTKELALFTLMAEWFSDNWTNPFIRNIYANGVPVTVDDPVKRTTVTYVYRDTILTDAFLDDGRRLWQTIQSAERTKVRTGEIA